MASTITRRFRHFFPELYRAIARPDTADCSRLLNGAAGARCSELLSTTTRRRLGAFFTPSSLADKATASLSVTDWDGTTVFDPACGAGDLLLPVARHLRTAHTVSATLALWNEVLLGHDISPEFVHAARLRLVLLARLRGARLDAAPATLAPLLTNIRVCDSLRSDVSWGISTHIIMNPPFCRLTLSGDHRWRRGTVNAAALFLHRAASLARPGTQIVAILPEVLRTGSSYRAWRVDLNRHILDSRTLSLGTFSREADVDVFLNTMYACRPSASTQAGATTQGRHQVGAHFHVSVGAVVPHRHRPQGPTVAYLHARNASPWSTIRRINERRSFQGTLATPPFVAIRRTSRPGQGRRAVATLVLGQRRVAVENHLIVARPTNGSTTKCEQLMALLASDKSDRHLNRRIRCRHLTVGSITSLPWSPSSSL